jgi:predicted metal-dependent phosphoesterase TrpH
LTRYADLHTHTYHSDGTRSPKEVIDVAYGHGLRIVAISDHDNLAAYFEIKSYADEVGMLLVPGIELSCGYEGVDVHILAYAFDPHDEAIGKRLIEFRLARQRRGYAMVERLRANGIDIASARVDELAAGGAMGRPHVARALVEAGYAATVADAFDKYIGNGKPGYVEKERFRIEEAVALIHGAGGVTSIAHPTIYPDHQKLVPQILDMGIDAVEVLHPDVRDDDRYRLTNLARFRGKFTTGGSDDHGTVKTAQTLGTIRVPETMIRPILERTN